MEKYHRSDIVGIERENERDETYTSQKNPQIDSTRTSKNYNIIEHGLSYTNYINTRIEELNPQRKIKDDAVLMTSFIIGSDGEFFKNLSTGERQQFFADATEFFADRYGAENIISAVVHLDETTPHLHLNLLPVYDGRLCAKKLFDRQALQELQSDLYDVVGKIWGLKRGKKGSTAKHLSTEEFKLKKLAEEQEKLQKSAAEIKKFIDDYESSKTEAIPFSGKKKQSEIIALRTQNKMLQRNMEKVIKDNVDLYNESKKKDRKVSTSEFAVNLINDFLTYLPDEFRSLNRTLTAKKEAAKPQKSKTKFNQNYK